MSASTPEQASTWPFTSPAAVSLTVWLLLLGFGGGCLALYYGRIGYLPEIAWEESLTYLMVLSIIGGGVVVLFGLLAFVPGVIWSEVLIWDCRLRNNLRHESKPDIWEPCVRKVLCCIGMPFGLFMSLVHLAYVPDFKTVWKVACSVVLLVPSCIWFAHELRLPRGTEKEQGLWFRRFAARIFRKLPDFNNSHVVKYLVAFVASALLGLASLIFIRYFVKYPGWEMQVFCIPMIVGANLLVSLLYRFRRWAAISVSVITAIFLLGVGEKVEQQSLLTRVMCHYGLSEQPAATLIVERNAGEWLRNEGVLVEMGAGDKLGRVKGVGVLSRLGKDYFLQQGALRFSLSKEHVISWSELVPLTRCAGK
jgi:hypothetical protein